MKLNFTKFSVSGRDRKMKRKAADELSMSSKSSKISTSEIQSLVDRLKNDRHRDTTKATYYTVWKGFNKFFVRLDAKPDSWQE